MNGTKKSGAVNAAYESPNCVAFAIETLGVLCGSGTQDSVVDLNIQSYNDGGNL